MKTLIFGSSGALGQELKKTFATENLFCPTSKEADLANYDQIRQIIDTVNPNLIINAAAYNNVDMAESQEGKDLAFKINGDAVGNLASIAAEIGATLLHFSTDYVFDGENPEGYDENAKPNPINNYGRSKLFGEELILKNTKNFYIVRLSRLFGKKGSSENSKRSFVDIILDSVKQKPELKVTHDKWGLPTFAPDLADACYRLIKEEYPFGIYHITNNGKAPTWYEFAQEIIAVKNLNTKLISVPSSEFPRPAQIGTHSILLNKKFPPLRPWQEALKEYLCN